MAQNLRLPCAMNSFIKACEVWTPTPDASMLEFGAGLFGTATAFGNITRGMCFGRGEGLPGRAWDEGRPIVLKDLQHSYFRRGAAAAAAGIHAAVALPIFTEDRLSAVLVLFCADAMAAAGAIELWHNNPRVSTDMTLVDGHFGAGGEQLEALSRDTYLPRGSGLPGMAWQRGAAVLIDDLGQSPRFLRGEDTRALGIRRGLAIPCPSLGDDHHVLSLLSASATPIAQRIESWAPNADGSALQRLFGYCEHTGALPCGDEGPALAAATGSIARAFASAVPQVQADVATEPQGISAAAADAGLNSLLAIPLVSDGSVGEVVVLYF
jgi:GAF domain